MAVRSLKLSDPLPYIPGSTLLLALSGWMDGGYVSTGTVRQLMQGRQLIEIGEISPAGFYIDSFPGSMEITALFRPHVKYDDGVITEFEMARNLVVADPGAKMVFFIGREPNINWPTFGECIFEIVQRVGCVRIIFIGSFGGTVPHTREPRLYGSVSSRDMLPLLASHGLRPTNYEGPASFSTYLLAKAPQHGVQMINIAAEIPGYLQGPNPLSIEAVTKRLAHMLGLSVDLAAMHDTSTKWELHVTDLVAKDEDLAATVRKLEEQYDNELIGLPPDAEEEAGATTEEEDDD